MANTTLNEKRLAYFYEAASCGSLRGAADRMNVEPSVVSRQIQQLENELGVALFERKGRGVVPTEAAALVMDHCRNRLASEEALRERLDDLGGLRRGSLRIVAGEGYGDLLMDGILDVFCRQYPGVQVSVEFASAAEAVRMVTADEAHIGVVLSPPADAGIRVVSERTQPICAVAWAGHPLAQARRPPTLQDISAYPVATMGPGFGLHQLVRLAEFTEGVQLIPAFTTSSIAMLKRFVVARLGVTFLSGSAVASEAARGEVVAVRTANQALESARTKVMVRADRPLTAAGKRMLALIEAAMNRPVGPAAGRRKG
ncbi:LysR family transcriptional regulator [Cupriavidus sp. 2TAF22]|uniref:LysR family transcriptional regulator n=1 Tax=unclassified Cupriavidus TaxID=2640874 RepID=UPI003F8E30A3